MPSIVHALGNPNSDTLGPCRLYIYEGDSGFAGSGQDVGTTMATTVKFATEKAELKNVQYGLSPSNRVITGASCSLETALTQPSLEVLESSIYGFKLERDAEGKVIGYSFASAVGLSDRESSVGIKLAPLVGGIEVTNPLQNLYFWICSPSSEVEVMYDDSTQRQINLMWNVYLSNDRRDNIGRPTFFGSGAIANIKTADDPNINSSTGTIDGGEDIVLIGSNFGTIATTSATIVDNDSASTNLTIKSVNRAGTRLTLTLPATLAAGTYSIIVSVGGRTGTFSITKA